MGMQGQNLLKIEDLYVQYERIIHWSMRLMA